MKSSESRTSNIRHRTSNIQVPFEVCAWHEGEKIQRNYDLEERLLEFASRVIDLTESLPQTRAANHVGAQILRSGTSPFPNHGEAEDAESREDFIHKLKDGCSRGSGRRKPQVA